MAVIASAESPPTKKARTGPQAKHLVLVGMRAAGKTNFGQAAAQQLKKQFLDLDHLLEEEVFRCKINAYVDANGWAKFREEEAKLLSEVLLEGKHMADAGSGCVISTGGGIVETESALKVLEDHTPVIWVDRHIDDIVRCLEGAGSYRPGLGASPREVYAKRRALYEKCSDYTFSIRCGDEKWHALQQRFVHLAGIAAAPHESHPPRNTVIVPIIASDIAGAKADLLAASAEGAGMAELRVDKIAGGLEAVKAALPELLRAAQSVGLPTVVTNRPTWEDPNASYVGEEGPRLEALRHAAALGATYIDVERKAAAAFTAAGGLPSGSSTQIIISDHDFHRTMPMAELRALAAEMRQLAGPRGVVKIAQMPADSTEAARMLVLLDEATGPTVALSMGEAGVYTRLLAPRFGATFTFGCLEGLSSAPGQPSAAEMVEVYQLGAVTKATKVFARLGAAAADRPQILALNAGFAAEPWDAIFVPLPMYGCTLKELLAALPAAALVGASVAPLHAAEAFEVASERDAASAERGAADALVASSDPAFAARGVPKEAGDDACLKEALALYALFRGAPAGDAVASAMREATAKVPSNGKHTA